MPIVNDLLVAYKNGYVNVRHGGSIAFFGHRQGQLQLGTVENALAAIYYGELYLSTNALPQLSPVLDYQARSFAETPYYGFTCGDHITAPNALGEPEAMRVVSISVSEDAEGSPIFGMELSTQLQDASARIARIIRKAGTPGWGTSELAGPNNPNTLSPPNYRGPELPGFSLPGAVFVKRSAPYRVPFGCRVVAFVVTVLSPGGGVNLSFFHNGVLFAAGLLPTDAPSVLILVNEDFSPNDTLGISVDGVSGTPPTDLLVVPRIAT